MCTVHTTQSRELIKLLRAELGDKAARANITLLKRILRAVDAHARKQGETRSGFLARTALDAMCKPA